MKTYSFCWIYLTGLLSLGNSYNPVSVIHAHQDVAPAKSSQISSAHAMMKESFLRISEDEVGKWNVSDSNTTCILLKGIIKLVINYTDTNNNTRLSSLEVPPTALATGNCTGQFIMLSWQEGTNSTEPAYSNNILKFTFKANEKSKKVTGAVDGAINAVPSGKFAIVEVYAVIHKNVTIFPNVTNLNSPFLINQTGLTVFPTTLNRSFACEAIVTIGSPTDQLNVLLKSSQLEAFRKPSKGQIDDGNFSVAEHCAADEISSGSIVGTAILSILGIVLGALLIAVVATYVLKRRRAASATGYETM